MKEEAHHHGLGKVAHTSQCLTKGVAFASCAAAVEIFRTRQKSFRCLQPTAFIPSPTVPRRFVPHARAWHALAAEGVHVAPSRPFHSTGGPHGLLATFATAFVSLRSWQQQQRRMRAGLRGKKRRKGPKKLKSGYWQEGDDEDDIDIYEWIAAEDLEDDPPVQVTNLHRIGGFSAYDDFEPMVYNPPEYRAPDRVGLPTLKKGIKRLPPIDQTGDRSFIADMRKALNWCSDGNYEFKHLDVVTSFSALRLLMAFVDGTLSEDIRAKGKHTRRRGEAELIDMIRIIRLPDAPGTLGLATLWNWVPEAMSVKNPSLNRNSFDLSLRRLATGKPLLDGPPSIREDLDPNHFQLLEYDCGDLRMLVRAPVMAVMPSVDSDDAEGLAVNVQSANKKRAGQFWNSELSSRYAEMQLGDVGMVVRGIMDKGASLVELQELTREDLRLDRPGVDQDGDCLLGRLVGLIHRIREVTEYPGCAGRPLYLQYADAELRVVAPVLDSDFDGDPWEETGLATVPSVAEATPVDVA